MPIEITIPRLGWSMEEGTFGEWLKRAGESVQPGEPLYSLESDKVTMDVESLDSGLLYLSADSPQTGDLVKPGQLIGYLLGPGEALPNSATEPNTTDAAVTPRARRLAEELGLDPRTLTGSGKGGRIREQDVKAAAPQRTVETNSTRRTIAKRMVESRTQTVPVTLMRRVDASRLTALRNRWKLALQSSSAPTFNDIIAKLVATALEAHPIMGGRWEAEQIHLPNEIHIGLAVDTDGGLVVPVLRNVNSTSLRELAQHSKKLVESARSRTLKSEDLSGGIFTISNLGSYGVEAFTPVINYPETAVLGLGAIRWEPVVLPSGQVVAREQMTISLTFDHRIVDGAPAARFLADIAALIEEPPASVHCP